MTEERQEPSLGVHFKKVSVFIESQRKWLRNDKDHLEVST